MLSEDAVGTDLTWLILLVAPGTYAMRPGPMLWGRALDSEGRVFEALQTLGFMLIAALLAVSVVPEIQARSHPLAFVPPLLGLIAAGVYYHRCPGMAGPVIAGVNCYGLGLVLLEA